MLQLFSLVLFAALWLAIGLRSLRVVSSTADVAAILIAAPLALLLADLASGVAHWFCDRFFDEDTPLIGPALIQPFREHHRDPLAMTRHGFLELNHPSCVAMLPLLIWTWLSDDSTISGAVGVFAASFLLGFTLSILFTNQVHCWAHADGVPHVVRRLQRARLMLSPEQHERHHRNGSAYCVTAGWLNAPLDRFRVFERIERAMRSLAP